MINLNRGILKPETIRLQRPPVSHICMCGQRDILVFPDTDGCLTWTCTCGVQRQITFRKNDDESFCELDVSFRRAPMDHGCDCERRDIVVLPVGRGELVWKCAGKTVDEDGHPHPCKRIWRMVFNEKSGELYSKGS